MRQAQDRGITLRLWGSLAIEYHSPSFRRLGFHETHDDIDFAANPRERSKILDFFGSLGYTESSWPNRGSMNAGWVLLKNDAGEIVEICFAHAVDDQLLARSPVTLPVEALLARFLVGCTENPNHMPNPGLAARMVPFCDRVDDGIALLLDHELVDSAENEEQIDVGRLSPWFVFWPDRAVRALEITRITVEHLNVASDRSKVLASLDRLQPICEHYEDGWMALPVSHEVGRLLETAWWWVSWGLLPLEMVGPFAPQLEAKLREASE
jgi:hypothetical protein